MRQRVLAVWGLITKAKLEGALLMTHLPFGGWGSN